MTDLEIFFLLLVLTGIFILLWIITYIKNRFTLWNTFFFLGAISSNAIASLLYPASFKNFVSLIYSVFSFFIPAILLTLFFILGIYICFFIFTLSARKMKKAERGSMANRLSLFLSIGIFFYIVFSFFYIFTDLSQNQIVNSLWSFINLFGTFIVFHFFLFVSSSILCHLFPPQKNKDYVIVLGSGLINGTVPPLLASRIDAALKFSQKQVNKNGKMPIFIFSGGKGTDEPFSEASAMAGYAKGKGLLDKYILLEDQSKTTRENMIFSKKLIPLEKKSLFPKILFSTNDYHVFRAGMISKRSGVFAEGLGSKTKLYYRINATIREYVAYLTMFPRRHIFLTLLALFFSCIAFFFPY